MVSWFVGRFHVLDWKCFCDLIKNGSFQDNHWYRANRDSLFGVILGSNQDFVELKNHQYSTMFQIMKNGALIEFLNDLPCGDKTIL